MTDSFTLLRESFFVQMPLGCLVAGQSKFHVESASANVVPVFETKRHGVFNAIPLVFDQQQLSVNFRRELSVSELTTHTLFQCHQYIALICNDDAATKWIEEKLSFERRITKEGILFS